MGPRACVAGAGYCSGLGEANEGLGISTWSREAPLTGPVCKLLAWRVGDREGARVITCISMGVCNLLANFKLDKLVSRRSRVQAGILHGSRAYADSQGIQGRGACEHTHIC